MDEQARSRTVQISRPQIIREYRTELKKVAARKAFLENQLRSWLWEGFGGSSHTGRKKKNQRRDKERQ